MNRVIGLLLALLIASIGLSAATIYVNDDAAGLNNGSSWANAYTSIQSALDVATSGDQIWVAAGTYLPSSDYGLGLGARYNHFRMINGVSIYGGFAGTETAVSQRTDFGIGGTNETIITGDVNGDDGANYTNMADNLIHLFYHPNGTNLNSTALLNGFTLRSARSDGSYPHERGGAISNDGSTVTLQYINFTNIRGDWGGAINNANGSNSFISNCIFTVCHGGNRGGGLIVESGSQSTVTDCEFYDLSAVYHSAAIIIELSDSLMVSGCSFYNLNSGLAAVFSYSSTYTQVDNCLIYENNGTPIGVENSTVEYNNCTIADNNGYQGGAVYAKGNTNLTFNNCIFYNNDSSTDEGEEFYAENNSNYTLNNCSYTSVAGYKDIDGTSSINESNSNIHTDPQFIDASSDDYRIGPNSPCIDAGNNSYSSFSNDIRGSGFGRKLSPHTGTSGNIDIGAYEFRAGVDGIGVYIQLDEYAQEDAEATAQLVVGTQPVPSNKGFLWDTLANPAVSLNTSTREGSGSGGFTSDIMNLSQGTVYYLRAYAINTNDTVFSNQITFRTKYEVRVDGNGDGIPDTSQSNVITIPNANNSNYITVTSPSGTILSDVELTVPADPLYSYPFGLLEFKVAAASAEIKIYYHGSTELEEFVYRKYYPDSTYKQFDNATFGIEEVDGIEVPTVTLFLYDGGDGDFDGIENGIIYDPGGPATPIIDATIPIWEWWWVLLLLGGGWFICRKSLKY